MNIQETMFIFGGTGSLGTHLLKAWEYRFVVFSRDEDKQAKLKRQFPNVTFVIGDIRNAEKVEQSLLTYRPNKIIIASALKHIDLCEMNIDECIETNVYGVRNVVNITSKLISMNLLPDLSSVVFISTDKATSPINAYGMCKSLCERVMAEKARVFSKPKFINVRYGNVVSSRGSIIPVFHEMGKNPQQKFFPVTNPNMTRFFMFLEDSAKLIDEAMKYANSGDTIVPKIFSYKIGDIAQIFSKLYNKPVQVVGIRQGEKLHECLINGYELTRTVLYNNVYVIKPTWFAGTMQTVQTFGANGEYSSDKCLKTDLNELAKIIIATNKL